MGKSESRSIFIQGVISSMSENYNKFLYVIIGILIIGLIIFNSVKFFKNQKLSTVDNQATNITENKTEVSITEKVTTEEITTEKITTEIISTEATTEITVETTEIDTEEQWFDTDTDNEEILNEDTGSQVDPNYISH